jgi:hypothetical protein
MFPPLVLIVPPPVARLETVTAPGMVPPWLTKWTAPETSLTSLSIRLWAVLACGEAACALRVATTPSSSSVPPRTARESESFAPAR